MSQNEKLLRALKRGTVLTPFSGLRIAGTLRLSERIRELQAEGHRIAKEFIRIGRARVMSYRMGRRA